MKKFLILTQEVSEQGCMFFNVDEKTDNEFINNINTLVTRLSQSLTISEEKAKNYYLNALYGDLNSNNKSSFQQIDKDSLKRTLIFDHNGINSILQQCFTDLIVEINDGFNDLGYNPYEELKKVVFVDKFGDDALRYYDDYLRDPEIFESFINDYNINTFKLFPKYRQNPEKFNTFMKNYGIEKIDLFDIYINDPERFEILVNADEFPEKGVVFISTSEMEHLPNKQWYKSGKSVEDLFDFEFVGDILNNASDELFIINTITDEDEINKFVKNNSSLEYFSVNETVEVDGVEIKKLKLV